HWRGRPRFVAPSLAGSSPDTVQPSRWRSGYESEAHRVWPSSPPRPETRPDRQGGRRAHPILRPAPRRWRWGRLAASDVAAAFAPNVSRLDGHWWTAPAAGRSRPAATLSGYR